MSQINSGKWYSGVVPEEVLRYSGVRDASKCPDDIKDSAVKAINEVGEASVPKHIVRECGLKTDGKCCLIDDLKVESDSLSSHIKGCDRVLLFGATLGSGVDTLIRRYSEVRVSYAVELQAAAAALIELYCDRVCLELEKKYSSDGYFLKPRFSPGYGDFSIEHQPRILQMLDAYKRIGLTVSGGYLMTPMKSVSAVIGLTKQRQSGKTGSCAGGKCAGCPNVNCEFRHI